METRGQVFAASVPWASMSRRPVPTAEELARELADAVAGNDTRRAIRLARQIEAQLSAPMASPRAERPIRSRKRSTQTAGGAPRAPRVVPLREAKRSSSSVRQTVTAALSEIGVPSRVRLVADYCDARFDEQIDTRSFSALRRDEHRAWGSSSPRPTYVVPALEGRFFQPIRGLLALSDWPIERRLIGPWSERADHLAATVQLARQLSWLSDRDATVAERLASIVASMARSIPGALDGTSVDPTRITDAAQSELGEVARHDGSWRQEAAARARQQLRQEEQLWGTTVMVLGAEEQ